MANKRSDLQIDRRVTIAMDALTDRQRAALESVLRSKDDFLAQAASPGRSKKLSTSDHLYELKVGRGLRVFFSRSGDEIVILDVMRKAAMDRLMSKKKTKASSSRRSRGDALVPVDDR